MKSGLLLELQAIKEFFERSTDCLNEEDSAFRPTESMIPVCQQVAHTAQTVDWFVHALSSGEGFDLNFEAHWKEVKACTSLKEARQWFSESMKRAMDVVSGMSEEELSSPLPEGPVMGGAPKSAVVGGISDHTAHHRGALTVYSRLLGKIPKMPYMEV